MPSSRGIIAQPYLKSLQISDFSEGQDFFNLKKGKAMSNVKTFFAGATSMAAALTAMFVLTGETNCESCAI